MIEQGLIKRAAAAYLAIALLATASLTSRAEDAHKTPNIAVAEQFVDAFYSFDPEPLSKVLAKAEIQGEFRIEGTLLGGISLHDIRLHGRQSLRQVKGRGAI